jgi:rod shape determining protein RodA
MIAFHTIVNVGMNIQILPVTGLPLPFVSAGGSSLLTFMLGIGLVESVIARHRALEFT